MYIMCTPITFDCDAVMTYYKRKKSPNVSIVSSLIIVLVKGGNVTSNNKYIEILYQL